MLWLAFAFPRESPPTVRITFVFELHLTCMIFSPLLLQYYLSFASLILADNELAKSGLTTTRDSSLTDQLFLIPDDLHTATVLEASLALFVLLDLRQLTLKSQITAAICCCVMFFQELFYFCHELQKKIAPLNSNQGSVNCFFTWHEFSIRGDYNSVAGYLVRAYTTRAYTSRAASQYPCSLITSFCQPCYPSGYFTLVNVFLASCTILGIFLLFLLSSVQTF